MHGEALSLDGAANEEENQLLLAYRRALTVACQHHAPCAHRAIDRRCLRQYRAALAGDSVGAGICFVCARRFPYSSGISTTRLWVKEKY